MKNGTLPGAYFNNPAVKDFYVQRVYQHFLHDEIMQGRYWEHGKGCLVGCAGHPEKGEQPHQVIERDMHIPRALAALADKLFEGLSNGEAKEFPLAFYSTIPVGADLSLVLPSFLLWLLDDPDYGVQRFATPRGKKAIATVVSLYQRLIAGESVTEKEWKSAYAAADAYAADAADAADAYAADAAAYAAADAADAYAADAADAAYAAYARRQHFVVMRDKLLALLEEAPV